MLTITSPMQLINSIKVIFRRNFNGDYNSYSSLPLIREGEVDRGWKR